MLLTGQGSWRRVGRTGHRIGCVVPEPVRVVREAGRLGDRCPAFLAAHVGQGLVAARRSVRVVPAGL